MSHNTASRQNSKNGIWEHGSCYGQYLPGNRKQSYGCCKALLLGLLAAGDLLRVESQGCQPDKQG